MPNSSGTITALNGAIIAPADGESTVIFNVTGTWNAVLSLQATVDGTNWFTTNGYVQASQAVISSFSVNQSIIIPCSGFLQVQLIATAFTSGTVNIAWSNSNAGNGIVGVYSQSAQSFITWSQTKDGVGNNITSTSSGVKQLLDVATTACNLSVTATGVAGGAVTATLPAVSGQFHYINSIEIVAYTTLARVGVAAPVLVTSANLPGANIWDFATAAAIGSTDSRFYTFPSPYKSLSVNTATTIVCPATANVIWRVNVTYYPGT
jgi:hypothetical protein